MDIPKRLYNDINMNDCENRINELIKYKNYYIIAENRDLRRLLYLLDKVKKIEEIINENKIVR